MGTSPIVLTSIYFLNAVILFWKNIKLPFPKEVNEAGKAQMDGNH
jgi:hypothetical protein